MITRREFTTAGAAAVAFPGVALAAHKPGHGRLQCDLVVDVLEWSHDGGLSWGNEAVVEGEAVNFRAVVMNAGTASSPSSKIIVASFLVDGSEVAHAEHIGGLAAGAAVTMEAADLWFAGPAGQSAAAAAVVDPQNEIAESIEGNNQLSIPMEIQPGTPVVVAQDDVASTEVDTAVTIDVLANDVPPEGMVLVVSAVQSPTDQSGVAVITPDQKFVEYTPPSGFEGEDQFTYETVPA